MVHAGDARRFSAFDRVKASSQSLGLTLHESWLLGVVDGRR